MVISSYGALKSLTGPYPSWQTSTSVAMYDRYRVEYGEIYRTQPSVRWVVDKLARNIAQLGLHVFERVTETDRKRLRDHGAAASIKKPNPATTRYRLIAYTVKDFLIYWDAYWLKIRTADGLGLARLPSASVEPKGGLIPDEYIWTSNGQERSFAPSEIVHFPGYDPCNPLRGVSPLETLRQTLAEAYAASQHRESFWRNGAMPGAVVTRPRDAPKWGPDTRDKFVAQLQEKYAGPARAGRTLLLEDGMDIKTHAQTARDSEYIASKKLGREEVALVYDVRLRDDDNFASAEAYHQFFYQDTLGPYLTFFEEELELQLLPEWANGENVYVEFNLAEKLKGSFEQQARSLSMLVGRPIMTLDEARARLNLPSVGDAKGGNEVITPKNVDVGAPSDAPVSAPDEVRKRDLAAATLQASTQDEAAYSVVVRRFLSRQQARLAKLPDDDRAAAALTWRWTRELADDLTALAIEGGAALEAAQTWALTAATQITRETGHLLETGGEAFSPARANALATRLARTREAAYAA